MHFGAGFLEFTPGLSAGGNNVVAARRELPAKLEPDAAVSSGYQYVRHLHLLFSFTGNRHASYCANR
jgi:hypothetical protein